MFSCRHAPLALPPEIERVLAAAYAEPHRAYHTAAHIAEVLRWYDHVADAVGWREPAAIYLAVVFHDAVYDPARTDNEARSAELARRLADAAGIDPAVIDRSAALILLTARHGTLDSAVADDLDAAHFLDCDTAILGAPPAEFDTYDAAIAAEYARVPAEAFRAGRRAFLAGLLARPRIFLSELLHARLDAAARANLTRVLARYQR